MNNFSEGSNELIGEIEEERAKKQEARDETLVSTILSDIKDNLSKITHHGKRADATVKSMLEHSKTGIGLGLSVNYDIVKARGCEWKKWKARALSF